MKSCGLPEWYGCLFLRKRLYEKVRFAPLIKLQIWHIAIVLDRVESVLKDV